MKVIRIKIPKTYIEIPLSLNSIYDAFEDEFKTWDNVKVSYYYIFDEIGNKIPCDCFDRKEYFITLEEYRNSKITELLKNENY